MFTLFHPLMLATVCRVQCGVGGDVVSMCEAVSGISVRMSVTSIMLTVYALAAHHCVRTPNMGCTCLLGRKVFENICLGFFHFYTLCYLLLCFLLLSFIGVRDFGEVCWSSLLASYLLLFDCDYTFYLLYSLSVRQ